MLLNVEDFRRLRGNADKRAVGTIDTMPDSLLGEFEDAIEAYADADA